MSHGALQLQKLLNKIYPSLGGGYIHISPGGIFIYTRGIYPSLPGRCLSIPVGTYPSIPTKYIHPSRGVIHIHHRGLYLSIPGGYIHISPGNCICVHCDPRESQESLFSDSIPWTVTEENWTEWRDDHLRSRLLHINPHEPRTLFYKRTHRLPHLQLPDTRYSQELFARPNLMGGLFSKNDCSGEWPDTEIMTHMLCDSYLNVPIIHRTACFGGWSYNEELLPLRCL